MVSGLLRRSALFARIKSSSAYSAHSSASSTSLIQHLPLFQNFPHKEVAFFPSFCFNLLGCFYENIDWKLTWVEQIRNSDEPVNFLGSSLHNDQQIHIAVWCGVSICVGTKQNDLLRLELRNDTLNRARQSLCHRWKSNRAHVSFDGKRFRPHNFILPFRKR